MKKLKNSIINPRFIGALNTAVATQFPIRTSWTLKKFCDEFTQKQKLFQSQIADLQTQHFGEGFTGSILEHENFKAYEADFVELAEVEEEYKNAPIVVKLEDIEHRDISAEVLSALDEILEIQE